MAESKLRVDLEEFNAEIARLTQRLSPDIPTVQKDFSLVSLVPKWSGAENSVPLDECLSSIERASTIGCWDEADCLQVAILRLADPEKTFYNTCLELQAEGTAWQTFKKVFKEKVKGSHTDPYHFMKLQTAKQLRGESLQTFADRLPHTRKKKVMGRDCDPVAQRIN